jgi:methylthioribose-1-phosphate isomerase
MKLVYASEGGSVATIKNEVLTEARLIKDQDIANNQAIGRHGQRLLEDNDTVLTHCNAGALCSAGYGTALGVIYAASENGKKIQVFADETRPLLQGARLTAWELCKNGIPTTVIADNMAASYMQSGIIKKIIVGADRIAANGDVANKIGTYGLAVLAKYHGIPFYVAAPLASIDFNTASGKDIPIEERAPQEISEFGGRCVVPQKANIKNPAFDVTPSHLVTALITEYGIIQRPLAEGLKNLSSVTK